MPFAATWMQVESITLKQERERQILQYHLYVESRLCTNEPIYEADLQT